MGSGKGSGKGSEKGSGKGSEKGSGKGSGKRMERGCWQWIGVGGSGKGMVIVERMDGCEK